jgi:monothiol glutaredoxin
MPLSEPVKKQIQDLVSSDRVVLFMKGNRRAPACGFSATVVNILDELVPSYATVDVLSDASMRDGIKQFSEWPTIPQLYVDGKFVGGCDIVKEMHASGELARALGVEAARVNPPSVSLTPAAAKAFADASADAGTDVLRLEISPAFEYGLFFAAAEPSDVVVTAGGLTIHVDRASARRADGTSIDYVEGPSGAGFKIENPNEPARVKQITPAELKAMLDHKEPIELFDVRPDAERNIATIAGARQLNQEGQDYLAALPKDARLVFHCHHGMRSQSAAQHFLGKGFRNVMNLKGGIDAWSATIDPSVPRY